MKSTNTLKPRDLWDRDDLLDFLDGWHEASDLGFHSKRDPTRSVSFVDPHARPPANASQLTAAAFLRDNTLVHPAAGLIASGRSARVRHRQSVGI